MSQDPNEARCFESCHNSSARCVRRRYHDGPHRWEADSTKERVRPTPDQIAQARQTLLDGDAVAYEDDVCIGREDIDAIRVLLAATAPPKEEQQTEAMWQAWKDNSNADEQYDFAEGFVAGVRWILGPVSP